MLLTETAAQPPDHLRGYATEAQCTLPHHEAAGTTAAGLQEKSAQMVHFTRLHKHSTHKDICRAVFAGVCLNCEGHPVGAWAFGHLAVKVGLGSDN